MRVVITGAAGFLGRRLAESIVNRGLVWDDSSEARQPDEIILLDQVEAPIPGPAAQTIVGDVCDPKVIAELVTPDTASVFHLAAVVSAAAEADFDLGMRVNIAATRILLERCRQAGARPKFVFTSSVAAFGGAGGTLDENAPTRPLSSYGAQKAVCEMLITDYSRKGFVDGRALRLPTIVVRPGKPNKAASSFASSILREPLNGERAECPVSDDVRVWIASPGAAIAGLMHVHDIAAGRLPDWRAFNLPGLSVTVGQMVEALGDQGGDTSLIDWRPDPAIAKIVTSWPGRIETPVEDDLGFSTDASLRDIVAQYAQSL